MTLTLYVTCLAGRAMELGRKCLEIWGVQARGRAGVGEDQPAAAPEAVLFLSELSPDPSLAPNLPAGRAMELGRECLEIWGYKRVDELVWVKTNQLQHLMLWS